MMSSCSIPHTAAAGSLRATSGRSPCRSTAPSNASAPIRTSWNSARPTAERRHAARQRSTLDPLPCKLQSRDPPGEKSRGLPEDLDLLLQPLVLAPQPGELGRLGLLPGQRLRRAGRQVLVAPPAQLPRADAELRRHLRERLAAPEQS